MRRSLLAALVLAVGCSEGPLGEAMVFSDSAGIRIVANNNRRPVWRRDQVWTTSGNPRLQLGNIPGDPDHQLYRVAHSHRLRDGTIAVANTGLGDVRIYGSDGQFLRTLTMPQTGAAQARPVLVAELGSDSLLVVGQSGWLATFDGAGALARSSSLASPGADVEPGLEPLGTFDDGTVVVSAPLPDDPDATGVGRTGVRLLRYAPDGRLLGSIGDFEDRAVLFAERGAYIFGQAAHIAVADSTIWYGESERYEVREIAPDGRTLRIVRLDRPGKEVTPTDISTYISAVSRQVRETPREQSMGVTIEASVYADTVPAFDQILADEEGRIWVRNYQWFNLGSGYRWTVFDADGRFLGDVRTPHLLEIHQIGKDFLLGRMADARGREAVYLWPLEKPVAAEVARGSDPPAS